MLNDEQTGEYLKKAKAGDNAAKETLISENVSLIKCIVKRYLNKGVEYDDLFQLACMGFLKAIAGFDEKFEVKFSTYAVPMIAGEIKRFMRDDGSVKVSRAIKQTAKEINGYVAEFSVKNGRKPALSEIAAAFSAKRKQRGGRGRKNADGNACLGRGRRGNAGQTAFENGYGNAFRTRS